MTAFIILKLDKPDKVLVCTDKLESFYWQEVPFNFKSEKKIIIKDKEYFELKIGFRWWKK